MKDIGYGVIKGAFENSIFIRIIPHASMIYFKHCYVKHIKEIYKTGIILNL